MLRAYVKICVLGSAFVCSLFAQGGESTQILGTIDDTSGAVIPGVTVTITHVATSQQRQVATGDSGNYVFTNITPGTWAGVDTEDLQRPRQNVLDGELRRPA